jgi:hypothetical protein
LTCVSVSSPIGSTDGLENIVTTNVRLSLGSLTYDLAVEASAFEWMGIGDAELMRTARTVVNLMDVCAMARVMSIQLADVGVRFAVCSTHWHVFERAKDLAGNRHLCNVIFFKIRNLTFIETGIGF